MPVVLAGDHELVPHVLAYRPHQFFAVEYALEFCRNAICLAEQDELKRDLAGPQVHKFWVPDEVNGLKWIAVKLTAEELKGGATR